MVTKVLTVTRTIGTCLGKIRSKKEVIHRSENTLSNKSNQGHELMNSNKYLAENWGMKCFMKGSGAADGLSSCFVMNVSGKQPNSCSSTMAPVEFAGFYDR